MLLSKLKQLSIIGLFGLGSILGIFDLNAQANPSISSSSIDFQVSPDSDLYHMPVKIKLRGLSQGTKVKLKVQAIDARGHEWNAWAVFIADQNGQIDPTKSPAIDGTYTGIHPMGLFWSMQSSDYHQITTGKGFEAKITAEVDGRDIAQKTIYRQSTRELEQLKIKYSQKRDSVVADFYLPDTSNRLPAIIFIGGSGGGFRQERASLLASAGFAVLDLKYFRQATLPEGIVEIPLEYVAKAHHWLSQQTAIDPEKIIIMGRSRGSELALLYAAKYTGIRLIVAEAPSSVVWFGWADNKSSWSYQGQALPYAEYSDEASIRIQRELEEKGLQYRDGPKFLSAFLDQSMIEQASIPVEEISCPILLISGQDDQVWPASMMAKRMTERLQQNQFNYEFLHLDYPDAGHNFAGGGQGCGIPFLPPEDYSKGGAAKGGTVKGNALAASQSWEALLSFMERHLK